MTDHDTQVLVNTAQAAAEPVGLDGTDRFYSVIVPEGGEHKLIDIEKELEQFRQTPRRKKGMYLVHDVPSFAKYFAKHAGPNTEVWADTLRHQLVAVLNGSDGTATRTEDWDGAQWEDHLLGYGVQKTDAWKAWTALNGKLVDQVTFAEHIEARSIDLVSPTAAEMLEIAQTFQATTGVEFESGEILASGQRKLTYRETTTAKAGQAGNVETPATLTLGLVPFEGAARYEVTARFRYRITGGKLALGYILDRPDDVIREAFADVVDSVEEAIQHDVLRGSGRLTTKVGASE